MTRKIFFDLVEIRTKLASFFPFLIAVLFTNTYFHLFHWGKTLFFFFGMIAFDMATTAINNYMDFRKAHSEEYKYQENIIGKAQLSERTVVGHCWDHISDSNWLAVAGDGLCLLFYRSLLYLWSDPIVSHAAGRSL